ncbi:hypothetical protein [Legionella sp. km772]|uniref:hypothetical protein n=1 Tax=Legionella sp. km772 TaxID=2498111 RepID=UPI000F8E77C1|nr:hypothetical protein [Legionella sp. km772]RUR04908.1 hypothetical protein ELY15_15000 [Legionella sp. km772]
MQSTVQILSVLADQKKANRGLEVSNELKENFDPVFIEKVALCIEQTHEKIELCSSLPGLEKNAAAVMRAREHMNDLIGQRVMSMSKMNERVLLKLLNLAIASQRAGNCYEFSFYAQSLLEKVGISTEVFRVKKPGTEDSHVFLVANLDNKTKLNGVNLVSSEAIVIDPFMKKIYFSQEIPKYLEVCVFDKETEEVFYQPFQETEHVLDKEVQKELVEDWQMIINAKQSPNRNKDNSSELDESTTVKIP